MGRKTGSYKFEKRQKELKKQKKKQEKLARRQKGRDALDEAPQPSSPFGALIDDADTQSDDANDTED